MDEELAKFYFDRLVIWYNYIETILLKNIFEELGESIKAADEEKFEIF